MGVSLITALEIQTNGDDIKCFSFSEDGKFVGSIGLWRDDRMHKLLLDTPAVYETQEIAIKAMENTVKEIRAMDLFKE